MEGMAGPLGVTAVQRMAEIAGPWGVTTVQRMAEVAGPWAVTAIQTMAGPWGVTNRVERRDGVNLSNPTTPTLLVDQRG
jgi:hypothetical protein